MFQAKRVPDLELTPVWSGTRFQELVQYPVIVESWSKKDFGRGKRVWAMAFTEREQGVIEIWYAHFRRWHLSTGIPERVRCKLCDISLLQRACSFFARI